MDIHKIAVGLDFSDESDEALAQATRLAAHADAELLLIHVGNVALPAPPSFLPTVREWEHYIQWEAEQDQKKLRKAMSRLSALGLSASSLVVEGEPAETLAETAEQSHADLLVIGTHGSGRAHYFLLGSIAQRVVRLSSSHVLVCRRGSIVEGGPTRILLATDFSEHAEDALRLALRLVAKGGRIDIVHFWNVPAFSSSMIGSEGDSASLAIVSEELQISARHAGMALTTKYENDHTPLQFRLLRGRAASGVVKLAKDAPSPYDLIVVGSHGRRGFKRFFLGSVAENIVRHAPGSVLVVHRPAHKSA